MSATEDRIKMSSVYTSITSKFIDLVHWALLGFLAFFFYAGSFISIGWLALLFQVGVGTIGLLSYSLRDKAQRWVEERVYFEK